MVLKKVPRGLLGKVLCKEGDSCEQVQIISAGVDNLESVEKLSWARFWTVALRCSYRVPIPLFTFCTVAFWYAFMFLFLLGKSMKSQNLSWRWIFKRDLHLFCRMGNTVLYPKVPAPYATIRRGRTSCSVYLYSRFFNLYLASLTHLEQEYKMWNPSDT